MSQPKVSIIVPVYNVERYLDQCLDSILAQTLQDIEIILVDDGSTDSSGTLCDDYAAKDSRIQVMHQPNGGYGKAVNIGFSAAKGQYLGIIESDDFIKPEMFERLYAKAVEHDADIVKSNFYRYWSIPSEHSEKANLLKRFAKNKPISAKDYPTLYVTMPTVWSAIYKTDFIRKNRIAFLETPGASYQDAAFTFKIWLYAKRAVFLDDAFVYYRQDNETSSINSKGKVFCICDECAEVERLLKADYPDDQQLWQLKDKFKFDKYDWNFWRLEASLRKDFLQQFRKEYLQEGDALWQNPYLTDLEKFILRWIIDDPEGFYQASIIPFSKGTMHKAKLQSLLGFGKSRLARRFAYLQQKKMRDKL
jgi:glycosyltransferase involved in cell wall biosynthesis